MVTCDFQLWKHALSFTGPSICLKSHPFCAAFALCFLNELVLIHLLVVNAQTSFISGRSVVHYSLYSSVFRGYPFSFIYYEDGTAQKYVSPSTEILLYSATTSLFPYFHRLCKIDLWKGRESRKLVQRIYMVQRNIYIWCQKMVD